MPSPLADVLRGPAVLPLACLLVPLLAACPQRVAPPIDSAPPGREEEPDRTLDAATDAAQDAATDGPAQEAEADQPVAPPPALDQLEPGPGPCKTLGPHWTMASASSVDMVALLEGREHPLVAAIVERPPAKVLAIEGTATYPPLRALYLAQPRRSEGRQPWRIRRMLSDPGPIRDQFGRRAYDRLVTVRTACHSSGCLIAVVVARTTPETEGASYTVWVHLLDSEGAPVGQWRELAHEPDRGTELKICVAAVPDGFVLATAATGGRGRLLWLDRRATPLDQRYLPGGFASCHLEPKGLQVDVVTSGGEGVAFTAMGSHPQPDGVDGGPEGEEWSPDLPQEARLASLVQGGNPRQGWNLWVDPEGIQLLPHSGNAPFHLSRNQPHQMTAVAWKDAILLAFVNETDQIGVLEWDGAAVTGRSPTLARADRVVLETTTPDTFPYLGWLDNETFHLRQITCSPDQGPPPPDEAPRPLASEESMTAIDERRGSSLRRAAAQQLEKGRNYRAAWLLERAYDLDRQRPGSLVEAAGLLADLRYSNAAMRLLQRLAPDGEQPVPPNTREAQLAACQDQRLARFRRRTAFQEINRCDEQLEEEAAQEEQESENAPPQQPVQTETNPTNGDSGPT